MIEEPVFEMERDLVVMVKSEKKFNDGEVADPSSIKANVLILSYNRPRMLSEAIESVLVQDYPNMDIYIVDDGSDFDLEELISKYSDERLVIAQAPRIPIEERMRASRVGTNLNSVIETLPSSDVVFYLCDDDIMAPKWVSRAMTGFYNFDAHVVAGESWYFNENEDWREKAVYGLNEYRSRGLPTAYWSTGNFAHKARCCKEEGLWWKDNKHLHSQDANFILDLWNLHSDYLYIPVPAVYKREHRNMLSAKLGRKDEEGRYIPGYVPPPASREHIEGPME